jgi:hypothetical protein
MAPEPNNNKAAAEVGTKKKRNRKKKTKNGPKEEQAQVVVKEPQNALNPAILLRNKLIEKEGFDESQIDKAMEEMWDQQLPYDVYESVLQYLKSGAASALAQAAPLQAPKAKATLVKEVAPPPAPEPEFEEEKESGVEESKEIEESNSSDSQPQISMASKLDMVAGFENFTDGAFALTEWVSKVAKPHEVRII